MNEIVAVKKVEIKPLKDMASSLNAVKDSIKTKISTAVSVFH